MRLRTILKAVALAGVLAFSMSPSRAEAQAKKPQTSEQRGAKSTKAASSKSASSKANKAKAATKSKASSKKATAEKSRPASNATAKKASSGANKGAAKKASTSSKGTAKKASTSTKGATKKASASSKGAAKKASAANKSSTKKAATPARTGKGGKRPQRTASTQPIGKGSKSGKSSGKKGKSRAKRPCYQPAVEIARGLHRSEAETFPLTFCDGKPTPNAVQRLSVLARPHGVAKPKKLPAAEPSKAAKKGRTAKARNAKTKANAKAPANAKTLNEGELVPGVRLLDEGLVTRLQKVVDHFGKKRIFIVSGYRPKSERSYHQKAKALDFRVEGVKNEDLVAFCRTLRDTGCGYYPNSTFVHMDVRPPKTGHVYWIDASAPGEAPRYVSSWPPPPEEASKNAKTAIAKSGASSDDQAAEDESDLPSLMEALGSDLDEPRGSMAPPSELNTL